MATKEASGLNFVRIHTDSNGNLYMADPNIQQTAAVQNDDYLVLRCRSA